MMKKAPDRRMQNVFIEFIANALPTGACPDGQRNPFPDHRHVTFLEKRPGRLLKPR